MAEHTNETFMAPATQGGALVDIESARAIQEVQASMIISKRFPRDQNEAHTRIMKACERYSLADKATYVYPRGGQTVKGPSIRLAEVIAQSWGNLAFGIRELSQNVGRSEAEAFAWDMETNTKQTKVFQVPHIRYSKEKGNTKLTDPRDIYENTANLGARRMRACILGIIPGDIVEDALAQCEKTIREGNKKKPLQDRIRLMLKSFSDIGINQDMIETRLEHKADIITEDELIELNNIGRSIADNMSGREDWFDIQASNLNEKLKAPPKEPEASEQKKEEGKPAYETLTKLKFKKWCKAERNSIPGMDLDHQAKINSRWNNDFPGETFPEPDEPPVEEKEEPEPELTPAQQEEADIKSMLGLIDDSHMDKSGLVVPCPDTSHAIFRAKCDGIGLDPCKSREGCPTWKPWDNK